MASLLSLNNEQHPHPLIIIQPQTKQHSYSRLTLSKQTRMIKTASSGTKRKVYNSYDSKSPRIANPNNWDCRMAKPFNSSASMYLTGVNCAEENRKQFILQDFSRYKKQPESYLPKYEIDKLFLEKISTPLKVSKSHNKLKPMKSQLCYNLNKQVYNYKPFHIMNKPQYRNEINAFSYCDVNFLKNTNPHIIKMKRLQEEFYKLRKNKPLAIVPGVYAIKKLTKNSDESIKGLIRHNKHTITNSTSSESAVKNMTIQTTNQTNET